jgi:hypothetical protein
MMQSKSRSRLCAFFSRRGLAALPLFIICAAAACSSSSDSATDTDGGPSPVADAGAVLSPGEDAFWTTFQAADYLSLPTVESQLQAEHDKAPDGVNTLTLAAAHFWGIAELSRVQKPTPQQQMEGMAAAAGFQEALQRTPDDPRIYGWLGSLLYGAGVNDNNTAYKEQGKMLIAQGIKLLPQFNYVNQFFMFKDVPASDPDWTVAIQSLWSTFDACLPQPLDRNNPDFSPYFQNGEMVNPRRSCFNTDRTPHNWEGIQLLFGDALVKNGNFTQAQIAYKNAKLTSSYASWKHASTLESRLALDMNGLQQLQTAFNNPSATMRQPVGDAPYACTTCHSATGK